MARLPVYDRLLAAVWDELGNGRIEERRLVHHRGLEIIEGLMEGGVVTINIVPNTLNTLVHELFHRRYPHWSERYVRARTEALMLRLTDAEQTELWKAYQAQVKRRARKKVVK